MASPLLDMLWLPCSGDVSKYQMSYKRKLAHWRQLLVLRFPLTILLTLQAQFNPMEVLCNESSCSYLHPVWKRPHAGLSCNVTALTTTNLFQFLVLICRQTDLVLLCCTDAEGCQYAKCDGSRGRTFNCFYKCWHRQESLCVFLEVLLCYLSVTHLSMLCVQLSHPYGDMSP